MRKIVASEFVTLDGVVGAPDEWQGPYFNDELGTAMNDSMTASDAMLLGRTTYEEFASFWPTVSVEEEPGAEYMNDTPKYVVSSTLDSADWINTTILRGDLVTEITELKKGDGADILLMGSVSLLQSLLAHNLVDELRLMVHPLLLGKGVRLFTEDQKAVPLTLVDLKTLSTGVFVLTYRPESAADPR